MVSYLKDARAFTGVVNDPLQVSTTPSILIINISKETFTLLTKPSSFKLNVFFG